MSISDDVVQKKGKMAGVRCVDFPGKEKPRSAVSEAQ